MNKREWMLQAALRTLDSSGDCPVGNLAFLYDAIVAASPEPADEGWIEHRGEKPYPDDMDIEIRRRDGAVVFGCSEEFIWTHDGDPQDIIAWRPAT